MFDTWSHAFFDANDNCYVSVPRVDPRAYPDIEPCFERMEESELLASWYESCICRRDVRSSYRYVHQISRQRSWLAVLVGSAVWKELEGL